MEYVKKWPICIIFHHRQVHLAMGDMPLAYSLGQIVSGLDHCCGWADVYCLSYEMNEAMWEKFHTTCFLDTGTWRFY